MEEENRSKPDVILRQILREEETSRRGMLKIFFGYAAGVGKTYSMLQAAHAAKRRGVDVMVGYVEPHARPATMRLVSGLAVLPTKEIEHEGILLREFDLDAAIVKKPQLILVDELAHTNAEGSRHMKRYQDIKELLYHGIDVYTTVNVQHIESLNDLVASITGVTVQERIPDEVFDEASQVELMDIEPKELIERLMEGKVYKKEQAQRALGNFFTEQNLIALREIALRRCADRVNRMTELITGRANSMKTDEHILVCLSPSPSNVKIIRTAARMAGAFRGTFTALYVETSPAENMEEENGLRLRKNIRLAQQLGANIETVQGDDIAYQVAEFARLSGVTKIIMGRSNARKHGVFFERMALTERITRLSPNLDIYIIPDQSTEEYQIRKRHQKKHKLNYKSVMEDCAKSLGIMAGTTCVGFLFDALGFSESNIIMVYILCVLIIGVWTSRRIFSIASSIISVLLFNFFFTDPRYTFNAYAGGYPTTFLIMFLTAFLISSLAVRIKTQARQSAATAYRTKVLFDTNQQLESGNNSDEIIGITCSQLTKLLKRDIIFYGVKSGGRELDEPVGFPIGDKVIETEYLEPNERAVATWVYHNNKHAGATTDTLGSAKSLYLSVRVGEEVYGVIGVVVGKLPLDAFENSVMLSILGECALALKNERMLREREAANLEAKNEKIRANLLRMISHDFRTPLTSISGNADMLMSSEKELSPEKRQKIYGMIYDESMWLIHLVENLLSVTRIENGTMKLNQTTELLDELVEEAIRHVDRGVEKHNLYVKHGELLVVQADTRLVMQVIINLINNAVKYTPENSNIWIETKKKGTEAMIQVMDDGEGISIQAKKHIFDMFYTGDHNKPSDSHKSLGLGLALCKAIVTAHGGKIAVADRAPHGTVFTFTLPMTEVDLHE